MKDLREIEKRKLLPRVISAAVLIAACAILTVVLSPRLAAIATDLEQRERFRAWFADNGLLGVAAFMALQILQILLAFIPGGPMQFAAGAAYGVFYGSLLCLLGTAISTVMIYFFVQWFKKPMVSEQREVKGRFSYLFRSERRSLGLLFVLFLIPGTPKDALTYAGAFLPIRPFGFVALTTAARAPAIIMSAIAGDSLYEGNILVSVGLVVFFALAGLFGLWYMGRLSEKRSAAEETGSGTG